VDGTKEGGIEVGIGVIIMPGMVLSTWESVAKEARGSVASLVGADNSTTGNDKVVLTTKGNPVGSIGVDITTTGGTMVVETKGDVFFGPVYTFTNSQCIFIA
jgi:hypothetical protein